MKKRSLVLILVAFVIFILVFSVFYKINYFNNIQKIIQKGNIIVEKYCEENNYEKQFGLVNIYKWSRFIGLKYLIYDKEIYEVDIAFNKNNYYWEGDSIESLSNLGEEYIQKYYPFLKE